MSRLSESFLPRCLVWCGIALAVTLGASQKVNAQNADSMMRLLKSGRIPASRQGNLVDAICKRGNAEDLAYILAETIKDDGFELETKLTALKGLADAATSRGVVPDADPNGVAGLLQNDDEAMRRAALKLAIAWKDGAFVEPLSKVLADDQESRGTRRRVIAGLAGIANDEAQSVLTRTLEDDDSQVAVAAAAALVQADFNGNGESILDWVLKQEETVDPAAAIQAFLNQQGGASKLAYLLSERELTSDRAKMFLRAAYAIGRSDADLVAVLSDKAGLDQETTDLAPEEMKRLVDLVSTQGDITRGEAVFRRRDLTCFNCHALSGAGGQIGPDLSAVGASSPADYLINALVKPEQDVKEVYQMHQVLTIDGQIISGVMVSEDDDTMILRDANGVEHILPQDDIEDAVEGGSLMPKGLKALMTEAEFIDLIAFLDEIGKPGPLKVRNTPTIQRWKVAGPDGLGTSLKKIVNGQAEKALQSADLRVLRSVYGRVNGELPWTEVIAGSEEPELVLLAEINVVVPGTIGLKWQGPEPIAVLLDGEIWDGASQGTEVAEGTHRIALVLDADSDVDVVMGELFEPEGSSADFTVVGGN